MTLPERRCSLCGSRMAPAPARWDGDDTFVGYYACPCEEARADDLDWDADHEDWGTATCEFHGTQHDARWPCPICETEAQQDACRICGASIDSGEICGDCAVGNDPFEVSKYRGDDER